MTPLGSGPQRRCPNAPPDFDDGVRAMRLLGQRSNTGLKVALLLLAVLVVAAAFYLLYLAPR
jgi:hypothetical protein